MVALIKEHDHVNVFRFKGQRGWNVRLEICAARLGSSLDSIVTLSDRRGHTLATSDDTEDTPDSILNFTLPENGEYFATVIDAHDKGGPTHAYLLRLTEGP